MIFSVASPTEPCALRSTQPLKVSTRDFSWGKGGRNVKIIPGLNLPATGHLGLSRETFTYMFRAHRAHHQERKTVSVQPLVAVTLKTLVNKILAHERFIVFLT